MAIDALATWKTTFAALPLVLTGAWTTNISSWVNDRVLNKAQVSGVTHASPPFLFSVSTFKTQLDALAITSDIATAANAFATAWETAINASTLTTLPGDSVDPGGAPALIWSTITSSVIDASSVTAAKAQMVADIIAAESVLDPLDSEMPEIIRNAFFNLTCSISGLNSVTPTPTTLAVSGASLI